MKIIVEVIFFVSTPIMIIMVEILSLFNLGVSRSVSCFPYSSVKYEHTADILADVQRDLLRSSHLLNL